MDFQLVLEKLLEAFKKDHILYALMEGFALGLFGIYRATVDLDFLINRDDLEKVHKIMSDLGYERAHTSENVSQYLSPIEILGEVDFLHAFRDLSKAMLNRAEDKNIFGGKQRIKVLRPEDIIGLKVQAMVNDQMRWNSDIADIEKIMSLHGKKLDWQIIEEYFSLFNLHKIFEELKEKYHASE